MKVGDYVRTDIGEIGKLEDLKLEYTKGKRLVTYYTYREVKENLVVFDNKNITQRFVDGSSIYLTDDELKNVEDSIVKSSQNIIDLIAKDDLLKIIYPVGREKDLFQEEVTQVIENEDNKLYIKLYTERYVFLEDLSRYDIKIKTIVTKEQFKEMEYKINE